MISPFSLHYLHMLDARLTEARIFNEMQMALRKAKTEDAKRRVAKTYAPRLEVAMKKVLDELNALHPPLPEPQQQEPAKQYGLFNHPERLEDEVFLGNYEYFGAWSTSHKTARVGNPTEDVLGTVYPVFIKLAEAKEKGLVQ